MQKKKVTNLGSSGHTDVSVENIASILVPFMKRPLGVSDSEAHSIMTHPDNHKSFQKMVTTITDALQLFVQSLQLHAPSATRPSCTETSDLNDHDGLLLQDPSDVSDQDDDDDDHNRIFTAHNVHSPPKSVTNGFKTDCLSPIDDCLKGFQRPFFCDECLVKADWNELMSRNLPKAHLLPILTVCAFHNFNVCSLECIQSRSNIARKVCKCRTCPTDVTTGWSVSAALVNEEEDLWCVTPTHINKHNDKLTSTISKHTITTTNLRCQCAPNQIAPEERKLSDQVLFNFPIVRKTVFKACDAKTADVDTELVSQLQKHHQILDKQLPHPKQRHKIITQLQTIKMFHLLRREHHFLPQCMEEFANLNPDASVALQGDKHN